MSDKNADLLAAATDLITHWDSMSGPEKRGEFEGVGYWSPAGRMVSTEFIVALRSAIAKAEGTPTPNSTTLLSAVSAEGE